MDHDQDGIEIEVPKTFSFIFPKEDGKDSEMQFAASGLAKPNIGNTNYDFDKESEVLIDYNRCNDNIIELSIQCRSMSIVQPCWVKISVAGKEMSSKATHSGYESYFIKDVTGAIHKCTTIM